VTKYAKETSVAVDKTRAEIERTLERYGASAFAYANDGKKATIAFRASDRNIRFDLALPQRDGFTSQAKLEQAQRSIWRAMLLCIKAKLEAVESAIESFDEAFFAHVVMPDGRTIYEAARANVALAYQGRDVPLLPDYSRT
jgi:hypothetical protein